MNRRNFLKTSAALTAVTSLPVFAGYPDLEMWVEENFTCRIGLPAPWVAEKYKTNPAYRYYTISVGIKTDNEYKARQKLTDQIIKWLEPIAVGRPELWWRLKPQLIEDYQIEFGEKYAELEAVEDNPKINLPNNVRLDVSTYEYRWVKKIDTIYKMRMRIAVPEKLEQLNLIATPEGAKIRTV
jgi:hypothetical protein